MRRVGSLSDTFPDPGQSLRASNTEPVAREACLFVKASRQLATEFNFSGIPETMVSG